MADKTEFIRINELTTNGTNFKCATCDNNISELRAMKFPICDDCIKDLREIIKERRLEKEKEKK